MPVTCEIATSRRMDIGAKYRETAIRRALNLPTAPHLGAGPPAPATAVYLEHNVFGTPTGRKVAVNEGEPMPRAALGFTWQRKAVE